VRDDTRSEECVSATCKLFTHSDTGARFAGAWAYTDDDDDDDDDDDALAKAMAAVTVATVNIVQHIMVLAAVGG
jgi:hypothetical protein